MLISVQDFDPGGEKGAGSRLAAAKPLGNHFKETSSTKDNFR